MPTAPQIAALLGDHFGRERIAVRSEFHVQVLIDGTRFHDVWVTKFGGLKWKLHCSRETAEGPPAKLIKRLEAYTPEKTDLIEMRNALDLSRSIVEIGDRAKAAGVTEGVFCDASVRNGKARISIVGIFGETVHAMCRPCGCRTSQEAESFAISVALSEYPIGPTLIYSDNESAVRIASNERVRWIPREKNKPADTLASLRGAKKPQ